MSPPIPIEVRIGDDVTVRGHEYVDAGPPVVFLHEPGRDLDAWGSFTAQFAQQGFKVLSLDLPGHGLSDGDEKKWASLIAPAIGEIGTQWGPLGLVAAGGSCLPLLDLGSDDGAPVQVLLSPPAIDAGALSDSATSMRLVMCGPADEAARAAAKSAYDGLRGQRLMITGGGADQGTDLIVNHPNLGEELVMWFRRYLTAYHLAWIKHITSTAKE